MPCCGVPGWISRSNPDNELGIAKTLVSRGFQPKRAATRQSKKPKAGRPDASEDLADLQQLIHDHAAGLLDDPLLAYRSMLERGVRHPALYLNLAQLELNAGQLDLADDLLDQTLLLQPDSAVALALQGTVKRRRGELEASLHCLRRSLTIDHNNFAAWLVLSVVLYDRCEHQEALTASTNALKLQPDSAAAHANHSMIQLALGDAHEAERAARAAAAADPNLPEAHLNLGNALHAQEQWDAAIAAHHEAIRLRPGFVPALSSLGNALKAADQLEQAEQAFRQAIAVDPSYFQAYSNLAITQRALGQLDDALFTCRLALEQSPDHADIQSNLGVILHERGEWAEAEQALRQALLLSEDHAESHFSLASVLLQQGFYQEGWREYEWRFTHNARHPIVRELPNRDRWRGPGCQARPSEIVLLHEQGLGDSFQFIRFAPLLRSYAKRVVMTCPKPLQSLFSASGLVDHVYPLDVDSDQVADDAVWLPLMSVPGLLGVEEANFGDYVPFLPVDPERRRFWKERLDLHQGEGLSGQFLIALNWQGNPEHEKTTSRGRSIPLESFAPLATLPGVRFVSLQKGYGSEQLETCSFRHLFVNCQAEVDAAWDFEDAAALMACASLVISSDTSAAHLAGAIGARLWMPLKRVPEWRWGIAGSSTPWYPSATLFRQSVDGDWSGPIASMRQTLSAEIMGAPTDLA